MSAQLKPQLVDSANAARKFQHNYGFIDKKGPSQSSGLTSCVTQSMKLPGEKIQCSPFTTSQTFTPRLQEQRKAMCNYTKLSSPHLGIGMTTNDKANWTRTTFTQNGIGFT